MALTAQDAIALTKKTQKEERDRKNQEKLERLKNATEWANETLIPLIKDTILDCGPMHYTTYTFKWDTPPTDIEARQESLRKMGFKTSLYGLRLEVTWANENGDPTGEPGQNQHPAELNKLMKKELKKAIKKIESDIKEQAEQGRTRTDYYYQNCDALDEYFMQQGFKVIYNPQYEECHVSWEHLS